MQTGCNAVIIRGNAPPTMRGCNAIPSGNNDPCRARDATPFRRNNAPTMQMRMQRHSIETTPRPMQTGMQRHHHRSNAPTMKMRMQRHAIRNNAAIRKQRHAIREATLRPPNGDATPCHRGNNAIPSGKQRHAIETTPIPSETTPCHQSSSRPVQKMGMQRAIPSRNNAPTQQTGMQRHIIETTPLTMKIRMQRHSIGETTLTHANEGCNPPFHRKQRPTHLQMGMQRHSIRKQADHANGMQRHVIREHAPTRKWGCTTHVLGKQRHRETTPCHQEQRPRPHENEDATMPSGKQRRSNRVANMPCERNSPDPCKRDATPCHPGNSADQRNGYATPCHRKQRHDIETTLMPSED
ncbi:hypothetical protein AVEN_48661-1 [Araneus ventricosus]|uniref:Uncharacterized protein n=1 Tax=Araneus ventricosus TaxID=182803 RepID=A0A4Y2W4V2_ARAVE|nr:hypothetical protein AVEN_48661-1 [Araneus ventricosus]